jgi:hypothetical protein
MSFAFALPKKMPLCTLPLKDWPDFNRLILAPSLEIAQN